MDNAAIQKDTGSPAPRGRRYWSDTDKRNILEQAELSGYSATGRKLGIDTSLLFQWRKQTYGIIEKPSQTRIEAELTATMTRIKRIDVGVENVINKLSLDLANNTITAYSAACACSSLTNAVVKLTELKLTLEDRFRSTAEENKATRSEDTEGQQMQERLAEQLLMLHAKRQCGLLTVDELSQWCQNNNLGSLC